VTEKTIPAGVYRIMYTPSGVIYEVHDISTDEILRFEDSRYNKVLDEIQKFWTLKEDFTKMGFSHKRGLLLYGTPGGGKSSLLKLAIQDAVDEGNLVFITNDAHTLVEGLKTVREIEPDRRVLCVLEDIDEIVRYGEHSILELFDGDSQTDNVLFLATTNYIDRLPPRILRAGRFDRKIRIDNPPVEGRLKYLQAKLKGNIAEERIVELAEKTDGLSFGQLREFLIATFCLKQNEDKVIHRLKNHLEVDLSEAKGYELYLGDKMLLE
jgi:ATP-dependent 26S proteasome regulatory subunit